MKTLVMGPVHAALLGLLIVMAIAAYAIVPLDQQLPIHWNVQGEPDLWVSAAVALLLPFGLATAMIVLALLANRLLSAEQVEPGRHVLAVAVTGITGLALVIQIATMLMGLGQAVEMVQLMALAAGILLVLLGNVLPKSQPNSLAGIRVPPSLRDPRNWQATQRVGGYLFMAAGASLFLLSASVGDAGILVMGLLLAVLVPTISATIYSYRFK